MSSLYISTKAKDFFNLTDEQVKLLKKYKFVELTNNNFNGEIKGFSLIGSSKSPDSHKTFEMSEQGKWRFDGYLFLLELGKA